MIVGSQARSDTPADEWSDLDVVLFHEEPDQLIASDAWARQLGDVLLSSVEPTALFDSRERRVLYADGRDVDFSVFRPEAIRTIAQSPDGVSVLARGFEVLLDKDGRLRDALPTAVGSSRVAPAPPSEAAFRDGTESFWYHLLWAAKKLRRGELWQAKLACDGQLKWELLRMIEWQAAVASGNAVDVWHGGRFLDRWADPRVRSRLPAAFAEYDVESVGRALRETGRLFSELAREVANGRGWAFPEATESAVLTLVASTLDSPVR